VNLAVRFVERAVPREVLVGRDVTPHPGAAPLPALGCPVNAVLVETIAGGAIGDGRPALEFPVNASGLAVGHDGTVLIGDALRGRVRRVDPTSGVITSIVGCDP